MTNAQGALTREVGLDVRVTDGGNNSPEGQQVLYWNDRTLSQDQDTSKYGVIQFASMPKSAKALQGTVTIDGEKDAKWDKVAPFQITPLNQSGEHLLRLVRCGQVRICIYSLMSQTRKL